MGFRKASGLFLRRLLVSRARVEAENAAHWSKPESYREVWADRAAVVADLIDDGATVCDIGCGATQDLRKSLKPGCTYVPCDMHAWSDAVEFCDLNKGIYPERSLARADVVTLLGVLRYLHDPARVFMRLGQLRKPIIFSYHPVDLKPARHRLSLSELSIADIVRQTQAANLPSLLIRPHTKAQLVFRAAP